MFAEQCWIKRFNTRIPKSTVLSISVVNFWIFFLINVLLSDSYGKTEDHKGTNLFWHHFSHLSNTIPTYFWSSSLRYAGIDTNYWSIYLYMDNRFSLYHLLFCLFSSIGAQVEPKRIRHKVYYFMFGYQHLLDRLVRSSCVCVCARVRILRFWRI